MVIDAGLGIKMLQKNRQKMSPSPLSTKFTNKSHNISKKEVKFDGSILLSMKTGREDTST